MRGFFGIGIEYSKNEINVGTLLRSAQAFGAAFTFTIGRRYKREASDTTKAWRHVPLFHYLVFEDFYDAVPYDCRLVGVEITPDARDLPSYTHPSRAVYLLGAEDYGLSELALKKCHELIKIPGTFCLNVSTAGSIVMYDRIAKESGS